VFSRNLENEEAKARYRAMKIQPQWVVTPGKQTNMVHDSKADYTIIPETLTTLVTLEQEDNFYKTCYEIYFVFSIEYRALNYEAMNLL
jgi:hypothetical protein